MSGDASTDVTPALLPLIQAAREEGRQRVARQRLRRRRVRRAAVLLVVASVALVATWAVPADAQDDALRIAVSPALADRSAGPVEPHVVTVWNRGDVDAELELDVAAVSRVDGGAWTYDELPGWSADQDALELAAGERADVTLSGAEPAAVALLVRPVAEQADGQVGQRAQLAALAWIGVEPPADVRFAEEPPAWWASGWDEPWRWAVLALLAGLVGGHVLGRRREVRVDAG